jgi:predicted transcriptional regulator
MGTTTVQVPLSDETWGRLEQAARGANQNAAEFAATLIEGALAVDELELKAIRKRLTEADAGGPFAHQNDVLAWLKALSEGKHARPPKATITF